MGHWSRCAAISGLTLAAAFGSAAAQTADPARPGLSGPFASLSVKIGTVSVRDLAFETPGGARWSIGGVGFTGLVRSGARVRAERIDIDKIAITSGSRTMEIPSIVISGADLPAPLAPILTTGGRIADLAALLSAATIDQITIPRAIQRDPAAQVEITYSDFVFSGFKGGTVASMRIGETVMIMPGAPAMTNPVRVRMGEIRYQQFDAAEMIRMLTGTGAGEAKRVLQRAVVDGIEATSDKVTARIKRVELADIDGRAPDRPMPSDLSVQPGTGPSNPEQRKQAAAFASDIMRHARIGRYAIEGLSVSAPGQGTFSLAAMIITGLSKRGIERIEVSGFDFRSPAAKARFDRFDLEGINYGALVEAALDAAKSGGKLDPSPAQIAQLMPRLSAIRLSRLDLDTPQGPVGLGDLRFEMDQHSDGANVSYALRDLKVDLRRIEANGGTDKLIALGYLELVAGAQAKVSWQSKSRAIVIETVGLSLEQIGRLDIAARLENVDIDKAMADPMAAEAVLNAARIGPIEVRLADLGLAARFYADTAKGAGISPDTVRAGLAAEMRAQAIGLLGPVLAGGSADAIAQFLQSSGTITARIAPAAGQAALSVAEIQSLAPPDLMQRLTVTLEAAPR